MPGWDKRRRPDHSKDDRFEMPADLAALQADDALLDLIGGGGHVPDDADDELTRILSEWRREVHAEPIKEMVDTTTAMAVIRAAARQPARRRHPVVGSAAAAAAVLVIAFSAVGLVAKAAQPGDNLWGVTQVLYSDYARSVETAAAVRTELNDAKVALNQGDPERARAALQRIQKQLPAVGEDQGKTELTARHRQLENQLNGPSETAPKKLPGSEMFGPSRPSPVGPGATPSGTWPDPSQFPGSPTPTPTPTPAPTSTPNPSVDQPESSSTDGFDQYPRPGYPPLDRRYPRPGTGNSGSHGTSSAGENGSPGTGSGPGEGMYSGPADPHVDNGHNGRNGNNGVGPTPTPVPAPTPGPGARGSATGKPGDGRPYFYSVCDRPGPRPHFCGGGG